MLLPIVDEQDIEIGVKERDALGKEDIYRVSAVWITDSSGRYLLAQRALTKKKNPGKWGPAAAGTVETGESYDSNIVKEIKEELGIDLSLGDLRKGPKIRRDPPEGSYFSQWYYATLDKDLSEFVFPEEEVMTLRWFTAEELRQGMADRPQEFLPIFHEHLHTLLSYKTES